jgi:hypothetical protein
MKDKKMADSKIDFSFENLHFSCEGDNAWVERQLNNVLSRIPALLSVHKKGESIVEEVIDVNEEDVKEVSTKAPRSSRPKADKVAPVKIAREKKIREKKVKTPQTNDPETPVSAQESELKVVETSKVTKKPKDKAVKKPGAVKASKVKAESAPLKRGRKAKISPNPEVKAKAVKKVTRVKAMAEPIDSPLAKFIADKKVANNQVRKFLATAVFLSRNNQISKLSTTMVSRALKSYGMEKLQNASDCLNKNEKKGYCIKEGKEFIITENGYLSIE